MVNQDEAQTVKVIYYLYLNGFSLKDIAELLTDYERKTKLGNTEWNPGTVAGIIANERHCGDVLARKTFTPNFLTHKAKKNNNDRTQYRQRDHHEAIVSRDVFNAANHLRASRTYKKKNHPFCRPIKKDASINMNPKPRCRIHFSNFSVIFSNTVSPDAFLNSY